MEITSYELKDATAVAGFFREIFEEWGWNERPSDYMDEPHLLFHLPNGGALLLIKENNILIGTAGIIKLNNEEGLIKRFYIKKDYRGTGIAKKLLDETVIKSKSLGITKLILDVSKNNSRAIRFYEKNDFLSTEVEPQKDWPESYLPETHFYFYKTI